MPRSPRSHGKRHRRREQHSNTKFQRGRRNKAPPPQQTSNRERQAKRRDASRDQAARAKVSKGRTSGLTALRAYPVGATTIVDTVPHLRDSGDCDGRVRLGRQFRTAYPRDSAEEVSARLAAIRGQLKHEARLILPRRPACESIAGPRWLHGHPCGDVPAVDRAAPTVPGVRPRESLGVNRTRSLFR